VDDLKAKMCQWEEWLAGDDAHSIRKQIWNMISDFAVFQSIKECRKHAPKNDKGEVELNGPVHRFIDRCFFESQAIAIRRLVDKGPSSGKKSVTSLYGLIDDMQRHCELLTREGIIAAHGYPYNYTEEEQRLTDEAFTGGDSGPRVMGQDCANCRLSAFVHRSIDSVAGVQESDRSPDDAVRPQVFDWLKERLCGCEEIKKFVDKFLAHPASVESRASLKPDESDVKLGQIMKAHETICQTAMFVSQMGILSEGSGVVVVLPSVQHDHFDHIDKPWATGDTVDTLRNSWTTYKRQTDGWSNWDWQNDFNSYRATCCRDSQ